ncbi:MAG: hypothetical protein JSS00_04710 [Proteobacteria bacterium]|nr:hypothetical protein [Pseudomonadota bacterium]
MTTFEFVSVLLSIVVSLAFAHLLTGIARLLRTRIVHPSLPYFGWVGIFLFGCVDYWFSLWQARTMPMWSLAYVLFWLALGAMLYLTVWLVVPTERSAEEELDLTRFHETQRRRFLGAYAVYTSMGLLANLSIGSLESAALVSATQLVMIGAAYIWRDMRVQIVVIGGMYALTAWYALHYVAAL